GHPLDLRKEMNRVRKPGGTMVVADTSPVPEKANALNAAERLRDPAHVRALPPEELRSLFAQAGLPAPEMYTYLFEGELEDLLARSFPNEGDADRLRKIFVDSIADNALDLNTRWERGRIYYDFPVAVLVAKKSN